mgnify:FL=1
MDKKDRILNLTKIKKLLKDTSISGYAISQATGVPESTISRIRTKKYSFHSLPAKTLLKLQKLIDSDPTLKNLKKKGK